jgi:L-Ala-D/L-Glu epimerase
MLRVRARSERWPLSRPFRISRGVKTAADVVVAEVRDGDHIGIGEAVPYARYGESIESVLAQMNSVSVSTRQALQAALPPGAARNAIDCALWDLEAKRTGRTAASLAGVRQPGAMVTAVTISLDTPDAMEAAAAAVSSAPLIKVKVSSDDPVARVAAVRRAAPDARLIVDPNEGWTAEMLHAHMDKLAALDVALLEQPIPAADDRALIGMRPPIPICADEAAHTSADVEALTDRYQAINIKLDKAGGLTEALAMKRRVEDAGLTLMVGCMVGTSLGVCPALLLAQDASFVDLDGPWWIAQDREDAVHIADGRLVPPARGWGTPPVA